MWGAIKITRQFGVHGDKILEIRTAEIPHFERSQPFLSPHKLSQHLRHNNDLL